jgi:CRISPR-associated protein Cas2
MVVLVVEKASESVRGELSRWLIEPKAGLFVGNVSAMVRDKLWEAVTAKVGKGKMSGALMLHTAQTEQGFAVRSFGETGRELRDYEGLTLVFVPKRGHKRGVYDGRFELFAERKAASDLGGGEEGEEGEDSAFIEVDTEEITGTSTENG